MPEDKSAPISTKPVQSAPDRFAAVLKFVLDHEGGYSDDPADHGGATNLGIIQTEYDAWRKAHGEAAQSVRHITESEAAAIYRAGYWVPMHGDELGAGLDLAVVDFAVNAGVGRATRELQACLGVKQDGAFGPETLDAVRHYVALHGSKALALALCRRREAFYHEIGVGTQRAFLAGWLNRTKAVEGAVSQC